MLPILWLLTVWVVGWCALPLSSRIWGRSLPDLGLAAGRILGVLLYTVCVFELGCAGVAVRSSALLLFPLLIAGAFWGWRVRDKLLPQLRSHRYAIIIS